MTILAAVSLHRDAGGVLGVFFPPGCGPSMSGVEAREDRSPALAFFALRATAYR
jgi:hypothetical protein